MTETAGRPPSGDDEKDRLIERLRAAGRARDDLLDGAAHELRNPMTALLVQVEDALHLAPPHDADLIRRLERIERLVSRTVIRATALLDASRLNAGTFQPVMQLVDLVEIIRDAEAGHA